MAMAGFGYVDAHLRGKEHCWNRKKEHDWNMKEIYVYNQFACAQKRTIRTFEKEDLGGAGLRTLFIL
jgi:hypothetical protein